MRTLLVDPGFGEKSFGTFGQSHWSSIIHPGLCSLSAYAKRQGFDVGLVDVRALRDWNEFVERIKAERPAVVGLTVRSMDIKVVNKALDFIKEIDKNIVTVVGGIHPTIALDEVAANDKIDYIILGEGEISFCEFLSKIERGESSDRVTIGTRPDLDSLPFDDRELYPYEVSINQVNYVGIFKPPQITMLVSRGCMFRCRFCYPHSEKMFGKKVRIRSVDNVIEELRMLRDRYHFRSVKFYDYTFTQYPDWVEEFCEKYKENGFNAPFWCQTRADLVCRNEQLIYKLKDAGLRWIGIGFESGNQRVLNFLRKGTTVEQNIRAAQICKRAGLFLGGSFMAGIPTETREEVWDTVNLAKKIRPHFAALAFFTPVPGNDLTEYCKERDLILANDPDDWLNFGPDESKPKIKGVDYEFLKIAAEEIMGVKFGGRLLGRGIKWLYLKTKKVLWLRQFLVYCYLRWMGSWLFNTMERRHLNSPRQGMSDMGQSSM